MKVKNIIEKLSLNVLTAPDKLDIEVSGGYASDLLSDVMANARPRNIWITLQTHQNIVAVAKLRELAAIVLVNNRTPEPETLKSAEEEKVPLLVTGDSAFTISWKIHALLEHED